MKVVDTNVFVINLKKDSDRLIKFKSRISGKISNYEIIEGVHGASMTPEEIKNSVSGLYSYFPLKSAVGCALSHIKAWEKIAKTDKPGLVLEDDVVPADNFSENIDISVPNDFDIFYLGNIGAANPFKKYNDPFIPLLKIFLPWFKKTQIISQDGESITYQPSLPLANHAYIITPKSARHLLNCILVNDGGVYTHLDVQILSHLKYMKGYSIYPQIFHQETFVNSNNVDGNFPIIVNKFLENYKDSSGVPVSYKLNVGLYSYNGITINGMGILFLILGIIFKNGSLINNTFLYTILLVVPEIIINDRLNTLQIMFYLLLFSIPKLA